MNLKSLRNYVLLKATEIGCSHSRAVQYFIRSVNKSAIFNAFKCPDKSSFDKGLCSSSDRNNCETIGKYLEY